MSTPDVSYPGHCAICGWEGSFAVSPERRSIDHEFRCGKCNQFLRFRDEAHVLIDEFGDGRQLTLDDLVRTPPFRALSVYHVGSTGPIRARLARLDQYVESRYEPGEEFGATLSDGLVNQDLQQLTFADGSFDLVMSSHVMEHVPDPWKACEEIARVLRPGGRMIFSVPTRFPLPDESVARAEIVDGEIVHHHEARYHKSPEDVPSLVFTDFGADMVDRLRDAGFAAHVRRPHLQVKDAVRNVVVVGTVPECADGPAPVAEPPPPTRPGLRSIVRDAAHRAQAAVRGRIR